MPTPTSPPKKETFAADTSKRTPLAWAKALFVLLLGLTVAHLGVTLFLLSELGTDTFTVFIQGLSRVCGLSVGTVHVMVLCLLMALMLLTTKGYVKPGTVVCAFCGGPIIDLFTLLFQPFIHAASPLILRIVSMLAGCVILAAGMAPLRAEALALEPVSSEFRMVGDCKRPRQILEAVREGYDAAMEV